MPDLIINSTRTIQNVVTYGGVNTTVDTCQLTILDPNLKTVVGPIAVAATSTGVYQFAFTPRQINIVGEWSAVWYVQYSNQALQLTQVFSVGS